MYVHVIQEEEWLSSKKMGSTSQLWNVDELIKFYLAPLGKACINLSFFTLVKGSNLGT